VNKRILILRPGAIGDTLLTFPLLRALKARYSHITFVSNPTVLPLAQQFGLADDVFDYGAQAWSTLFSPSGIRSSFVQNMLQHTDTTICWLRDPDGIVECNIRKAGVAHVIIAPGRPNEASETHIVTYLAHTLGISLTEQEMMQPFLSRPSNTAHTVAIHPGSGGAAKCWSIESFASVIAELWRQQLPVLLLTGPADTGRLTTLLKLIATPPTPSLLEIMTNAPLVDVAEHLHSCDVYLGNDSGITHLAAMLGLPTIALFGPSNPAIWRPVGPHVQVLCNPELKNIRVEVIVAMLTKIMREEIEQVDTVF